MAANSAEAINFYLSEEVGLFFAILLRCCLNVLIIKIVCCLENIFSIPVRSHNLTGNSAIIDTTSGCGNWVAAMKYAVQGSDPESSSGPAAGTMPQSSTAGYTKILLTIIIVSLHLIKILNACYRINS
jgi:hypothetical protein